MIWNFLLILEWLKKLIYTVDLDVFDYFDEFIGNLKRFELELEEELNDSKKIKKIQKNGSEKAN